jgi:heme/copper-type cytochrome/quinol oxidase subunit 4
VRRFCGFAAVILLCCAPVVMLYAGSIHTNLFFVAWVGCAIVGSALKAFAESGPRIAE